MAGKEYTIVDGVLFNGARDNEGGIWIRIRDDQDHRILAAAIAKQKKNQEAAGGTLSALDPQAPHLIDYVGESLSRVLESVNGARPASAQLSGTPIGDAIAGESSGKGTKRGKRGKGAKDGSDAAQNSGVAGSIGPAEEIQWADDVPSPRPRAGEAFWTAIGFANEVPQLVKEVLGYDSENSLFVVMMPGGEKASIVWNADWHQWIGAGVQPSGPATLTADLATAAAKELVAALRAGPADLEDSQFEAAAHVARALLEVVATANNRLDEIRTVVEYIDEYRTNAENAVELAGGIEYDLSQAASLDAIAGADESPYEIVGTEPGPGVEREVERENEPDAPRRKRSGGGAKKSAAKKATGKTAGKRKR